MDIENKDFPLSAGYFFESEENIEIVRKIVHLLCVYSVDLCERKVEESHECFPLYRDSLFACLAFHLVQVVEQQSFNLDEAVALLQEGFSPVDRRSLGGNPLYDSVLAVAMTTKENKAAELFEKNYFAYLEKIAWRVHPVFGHDSFEWWNEFLDFLAGYTHSNGKLKNYQGKSALKSWLRVVLWNFLRRRSIPGNAPEFLEDTFMTNGESDDLALGESINVFSSVVREALESMVEKERLLLSMIYIDDLPKKDIAFVFQVHPGQIGRWQENALNNLRGAISGCLEKLPDKNLHDEMMGGIVNNPQEFSAALVAALQKLRTDDTDK